MDESYHDYVIKDGRLIGRFEEMYARFDDPWNQSDRDYCWLSKSRWSTILNIRKYCYGSIVEFGSGLGHYTHMISTQTDAIVTGVDISPTAIQKARRHYPEHSFVVDAVKNIHAYHDRDAVLFAEITWYILDDLKEIFDRMLESHRGKHFLHNLVFYKGSQRYGREFFTTFEEFAAFCPFKLIEHCSSTTSESESSIDTSSVFLIEPK